MMGWGYGMGGVGWLLMTGFWVLLIAVLVGLAAWIFPRQGRQTPTAPAASAREVLDQRLARGEIDVETYQAVRDELARAATRSDA
jgi:putative membrane protein